MPAAARPRRYSRLILYVKIVSWILLFTGLGLLVWNISTPPQSTTTIFAFLLAGAVLYALSPVIGSALENRKP